MKNKLIVIYAAITLLCVSCASFPATAGKSLATTAATVDASMKGWAAWVALGKSNPAQEAQVRDNYHMYQLAMMAATNAYAVTISTGDKTVFNEANVKLQASKDHVVSTVNTAQALGK